VLKPGGVLLISVPAYTWAWSDFDVANGHHRRYTRPRVVDAVQRTGLTVERATYAFASVFPFFAAERIMRRIGQRLSRREVGAADIVDLPQMHPALSRTLLGLTGLDRRALRRGDLPFGSSVVLAARKPVTVSAGTSNSAV